MKKYKLYHGFLAFKYCADVCYYDPSDDKTIKLVLF